MQAHWFDYLLLALALPLLPACGDSSGGTPDAGTDGSVADASGDAGTPPDGGATDSSRVDAGMCSDNPAGISAASLVIWSQDYSTEDPSTVLSQPTIAVGTWGSSFGFGPSGGWRFQPDPIDGTAESEDSAGWLGPGPSAFPIDTYELVTVSFMLQISRTLLDEIARGGPFWSHVNKVFDFKYWSADGGEGGRNGIHFGEDPPQFHFSTGGGGQFQTIGPDWRELADEWVWVCFVVDMRGDTAAERYLAAFYKPEGGCVTEMGTVAEDNDLAPLQTYDGHGFAMFFSPLFGYWDDMNGRDSLAGALSEMAVSIDRVRITDGWPTGDDGPPF